jgi:Mrp family chromosome partitioning ATPase
MQVIGQFLGDVAWGELDYLIVDLPPGSSDEPLSVAQNIPDADGMVLVTTPQEVAVGDVRKSVNFARKLEMPVLGVIENMSGLTISGRAPPGCDVELDAGGETAQVRADTNGAFETIVDVFGRGGGEAMAHEMGVPFLGRVPLDLRIGRSGDTGKPFVLADLDTPAKQAFAAIVERLVPPQRENGA